MEHHWSIPISIFLRVSLYSYIANHKWVRLTWGSGTCTIHTKWWQVLSFNGRRVSVVSMGVCRVDLTKCEYERIFRTLQAYCQYNNYCLYHCISSHASTTVQKRNNYSSLFIFYIITNKVPVSNFLMYKVIFTKKIM